MDRVIAFNPVKAKHELLLYLFIVAFCVLQVRKTNFKLSVKLVLARLHLFVMHLGDSWNAADLRHNFYTLINFYALLILFNVLMYE